MTQQPKSLYDVLRRELVQATAENPITANELFENIEDVRKFADEPSRVSDYLSTLFRQNKACRTIVPQTSTNSRARYGYYWNTAPPLRPMTSSKQVTTDNLQYQTPKMDITQDGDRVVITLPNIIITIQTRDG